MRRATSKYIARPAAFGSETRDCAVRALRVAAEIPYTQAHALLKSAGRLDRRGTYNSSVSVAAGFVGLYPISYPAGGGRPADKPTLAQFIRAHRTGRFVIRTNRHFFALVNGVVHDFAHTSGPRSRVIAAWGVAP